MMRRTLKRGSFLWLAVLLLTLTSHSEQTEPPCDNFFTDPDNDNKVCQNISTGSEGSGSAYVGVFGKNFSEFMSDYDFGVFPQYFSRGSGENLMRIAKGESALGLAQKDVQIYFEYKYKGKIKDADANSEAADEEVEENSKLDNIVVLSELSDECVYVAYNKNKATKGIADLRRRYTDPTDRPFINIGTRGSGSFYTWKFITALNPNYGYADKVSGKFYGMSKSINPFDEALGKLANSASNTEAVMWVIDPNKTDNAKLRTIQDNPDLEIMDFDDSKLVAELSGELFDRDAKELLELPDEDKGIPVESPDTHAMLAAALAGFEQAEETSEGEEIAAEAFQGAASSNAYFIRTVEVGSGKTVNTICTKAALYAHTILKNPDLKVEYPEYTQSGVLWGEMLGLLNEYWPEIITQN